MLLPPPRILLCGADVVLFLLVLLSSSSSWIVVVVVHAQQRETFVLIPKSTANPFFDVIRDGCVDQAELLSAAAAVDDGENGTITIECIYRGPASGDDATEQVAIMDDIIAHYPENNVTGIIVSVLDPVVVGPRIDAAVSVGIPVVTADSDAPDSQRAAYIGSNNVEIGHSFAWLLAVGGDLGGKYGLISSSAGANLQQRVDGFEFKLAEAFDDSGWAPIGPPLDCQDDTDTALSQVEELANNTEVNAILSMGGWPMFSEDSSRWKAVVESRPDILYLVADTLPVQLLLFEEGYVNGLVGQRPYEMGMESVNALLRIKANESLPDPPIIYTTEQILFQQTAVSPGGGGGGSGGMPGGATTNLATMMIYVNFCLTLILMAFFV